MGQRVREVLAAIAGVALLAAACGSDEESGVNTEPVVAPLEADVDYGSDPAPGSATEPRLDVWAQEGLDAAPVVVVLHGLPGSRSDTSGLAKELANRGYLALNPDIQFADPGTLRAGGTFQVACAIRHARATAAEFGGDPNDVVIIGISFGGMLGSSVALNGDEITGLCSNDDSLTGTTDGLVTFASPTDFLEFSHPVGYGEVAFAEDAELWEAFNPYEQLDQADGFPVLVIHGDTDDVVSYDTSVRFNEALAENGADVTFETFEGLGHDFVPVFEEFVDLIDSWMQQR